MVTHIGSTDPELRDELIFMSFVHLIIERNQLNASVLDELLTTCLDDLLMKGLGENGTDTVFTRAFTTLLMSLIIYRDNEDNYLSSTKVKATKDHVITYLKREQDVRGFVPGKGWAHSVAHVADLVDELVKNPKVDKDVYPKLLQPLLDKVLTSDSVYLHGEDERILIPTMEMLDRGLDELILENWIQSANEHLKSQQESLSQQNYWFLHANLKTFLKSLYFELNKKNQNISLQKSIEHYLGEI